jgi:hypothetical protein
MTHHVPGRTPDPVAPTSNKLRFHTYQLLDGCNSELCMLNVFNCHHISHQIQTIVLNHQYCGEHDASYYSNVMSAANLGLRHFNMHKMVQYIVVVEN